MKFDLVSFVQTCHRLTIRIQGWTQADGGNTRLYTLMKHVKIEKMPQVPLTVSSSWLSQAPTPYLDRSQRRNSMSG